MIHFHRWSRWMEPVKKEIRVHYKGDVASEFMKTLYVQERTCASCGMVQRRAFDDGGKVYPA